LASSEGPPNAGAAAAHFIVVLHVVEDERGVVEEFDGGGECDAVFRRNLQAVREVEAESGAHTFAGALEEIGGALAELTRRAGGVGQELLDESESVVRSGD
jgi:hypothetical protein